MTYLPLFVLMEHKSGTNMEKYTATMTSLQSFVLVEHGGGGNTANSSANNSGSGSIFFSYKIDPLPLISIH